MGGDSPEFAQIVTDPDILPEADMGLGRASGITRMGGAAYHQPSASKMAAALAGLRARSPAPPQPVSKAPALSNLLVVLPKHSEPEDAEPRWPGFAKQRTDCSARGVLASL